MDADSRGTVRTDRHERTIPLDSAPRRRGLIGRARRLGRFTAVIAVIAAAVIGIVLVLSAVHLLPQFRNPLAVTTVDRSSPALLKSISALSRYEAASGSFRTWAARQKRPPCRPRSIWAPRPLSAGQAPTNAFWTSPNPKGTPITVSANGPQSP